MRFIQKKINEILTRQNNKGFETYGHYLEDAADEEFDWENMLIEELIDAIQYSIKENMRLKSLVTKLGIENNKLRNLSEKTTDRFQQIEPL